MKMKWATYWFRLQNTTLFFYTKKDRSPLHLKGLYYIYTIQSVREVQRDEGKRFVFEIIMTNGKRKVLSAETAALRKEWMSHLWKAMNLKGESNNSNPYEAVSDPDNRGHSSTYSGSDTHDSATDSLDSRPLQDPQENNSTSSSTSPSEELNSEDVIEQNTPSLSESCSGVGETQWSESKEKADCDYDVLPCRNTVCLDSQSNPVQEGIYDIPPRRTDGEQQESRGMMESIYDVPSSLLKKFTEHTPEDSGEADSEERLEEDGGLLVDMMTSLGIESLGWETDGTADSGNPYKPAYF